MSAHGRDLDLHVGVQGQLHQRVMQSLIVCHIEDADVGVQPRETPQMAPGPFPLQALGEFFFVGLELGGFFGRHIGREFDGHAYVEKHVVCSL